MHSKNDIKGKGGKNVKLRTLWILPNVFSYMMVIGFSVFIASQVRGIEDIKFFTIPLVFIFLLFIVTVFGSYRISTWIKDGKI